MGAMLGFPPEEMGGKFARIGGATDMREWIGDNSQSLIRERGRWASDVAAIYQRALLKSHLRASVGVGGLTIPSRDMEALVKGWTQPSTFR